VQKQTKNENLDAQLKSPLHIAESKSEMLIKRQELQA